MVRCIWLLWCSGLTFDPEALVRSWIDAVKGWGVNERGQPSNGGFGFGKFHLFPRGRDLVFMFFSLPLGLILTLGCISKRLDAESPPQAPTRPGRAPRNKPLSSNQHVSRTSSSASAPQRMTNTSIHQRQPRQRVAAIAEDEVVVDVIFSAHSDGLMVILTFACLLHRLRVRGPPIRRDMKSPDALHLHMALA